MPKPIPASEDKRHKHRQTNPLHDKRMRTLRQSVKIPADTTTLPGGQTRCEGLTHFGTRCMAWATRGNVFCIHHGGAVRHEGIGSIVHQKKRPAILRETSLYLKTLNKQEQETFDQILDKLAIKPELSMLRTKLNSMLERYGDDWIPTRKQMEFMTRTIERLSLISERITRTVEGYRIKVTVDRQAMEDLFNVCKEFVPSDRWEELAAKLVATADAASGRAASASLSQS